MEPIISSKTQMCRICPNTLNLIDLNLPENDFILKDLESFVFVEMELSEQLPKYICAVCNTALNNAVKFKTKISERLEEIRSLIEVSMKPIKSEIIFTIEEVILDSNFEEPTIKAEINLEEQEPSVPNPAGPSQLPSIPKSSKYTGKCKYCDKQLASYKEMIEHNKTHTDCHLCPKKYGTFDCFKYHFNNIHLKIPRKNEDQKYSCELCGKEFKWKKNVAVHIKVFHNKERNYACEICGKRFSERNKLDMHTKTVHSDERPFTCDICNKDFKLNETLKLHKRTNHEGVKQTTKIFICTICGKQSRGLTSFQIHQRIHTNELPYDCKTCNKKFRTLTELRSHKLLHTGEKPYKCDVCPKRFRLSQYLKNHKLSHGGNNLKKFDCKLCGMSTVYERNLETHMKTVHMQIKNFDCKICGESFTKITLLKKHSMDSHNLSI